MEEVKKHTFKVDHDQPRQVCVCGKPFLDAVHTVSVTTVRGVATPTKIG